MRFTEQKIGYLEEKKWVIVMCSSIAVLGAPIINNSHPSVQLPCSIVNRCDRNLGICNQQQLVYMKLHFSADNSDTPKCPRHLQWSSRKPYPLSNDRSHIQQSPMHFLINSIEIMPAPEEHRRKCTFPSLNHFLLQNQQTKSISIKDIFFFITTGSVKRH